MNSQDESRPFGFFCSRTLAYSLDNHSRLDKWHYMGYELQYHFSVHFYETVKQEDRKKFLDMLLGVFQNCFGLPRDGHCQLGVSDIGISEHVLKVFWDKGRLDLRLLKRLEDEINNVAILSRTTVELVSLIIIPRSRETIGRKIRGKV